jgi:signal transduction histidine kinase
LFGEDRPDDVIGKNVSVYYSEKYSQSRKKEMIPALLRVGHWHTEQTVMPRQGKPLHTLQSTFLIRDEDGSPLRIAVVISDITERKRAEDLVKKEYQNLKHLLRSSDHERRLIAYEIHDGVAQHLAAAIMQLQAFDNLKDKNREGAAAAFEAGITMLRQGHFETRRLIAGVRPPILDEAGVAEAISHLVLEQSRCTGQAIDTLCKVEFDRLDPTLENAIYRIAQEALTNACQYSKSEKVEVSLVQHGDLVRIEIQDWGTGFDPKTVPRNHFGLEGIRQRARMLGGKCSIRSAVGKGTHITVELPVVLKD